MIDLPELPLFKKMSPEDIHATERMWQALWHNFIRNKGTTALTYWAEQFSSPMTFNGVLYSLRDMVSTQVIPNRNWAEVWLNEDYLLSRFTQQEIALFRQQNKLAEYTPEFVSSRAASLVKTTAGIARTGLFRAGFRDAADTQFYYDTSALKKHKAGVIRNTVKGMAKMRLRMPQIEMDEASYDSVAALIVEKIADEAELYTLEGNVSDSRGRAIKGCLKKVANPIGFKDFRSLLVIPNP